MTDSNLAPIPTGWQTSSNGGNSVAVGGADGSNVTFDASNQYNGGNSVKISAGNLTLNPAHECDGPWIPIKSGDHITFSAYIRTGASTLNDGNNPQAGGRIGLDIYDNQGYLAGINNSRGGADCSDVDNTYVKWGTWTWTAKTIDFVVAANYVGKVPTGFIPWLQIWSDVKGAADGGSAWFGGISVVKNPSATPAATPATTPAGPTQAQYDALKTQLATAVSQNTALTASNTSLQTAQTALQTKIAGAIKSLQT